MVLFGLGAVAACELFANTRRFTRTFTQVVELRSPHVALALDLDRGDQRRIRLKCALDAFAARDLAHGERRVEAAIAFCNYDTLIGLHAFALALDDTDVDDDGVAGREDGNGLAQARNLFLLQLLDDVHCISPERYCANRSCSKSLSVRPCSSAGLRFQVRPSACIFRQRAIAAWLPDSSIAGTCMPSKTSGRV